MVHGKDIISVQAEESPVHAFQKIVDHKILSAPVFDKASNKWIGFLDTRDLVQFVVYQADETEAKKHHQVGSSHDLLEPPPQDLNFIFESAAKMYKQPLEGITVSYMARTNKFTPVHPEDRLLDIVELLATGYHRVPVMDRADPNKILDIVSQSTLLQFLYKFHANLAKDFSVKISEINLGSRPVIPVVENVTALEAFREMARHNRSGIAIIDRKGAFVGNTSGSDLKAFIRSPEKHMRLLHKPITDFLATIRRAEVMENPNTRSPTIAVHPDATLEKVIGKLTATRIHRLFVADDAQGYKPIAVISITDILRYVLIKIESPTTPRIVIDSS